MTTADNELHNLCKVEENRKCLHTFKLQVTITSDKNVGKLCIFPLHSPIQCSANSDLTQTRRQNEEPTLIWGIERGPETGGSQSSTGVGIAEFNSKLPVIGHVFIT